MFSLIWVCQLGLYKTSLYSKHNDAKTKKFKLKILVYIINHQTLKGLSTKHPIFSPIPLPNSASFAALETLGGRLQLFFELQKQMNDV
jgi:hypothetical protein